MERSSSPVEDYSVVGVDCEYDLLKVFRESKRRWRLTRRREHGVQVLQREGKGGWHLFKLSAIVAWG